MTQAEKEQEALSLQEALLGQQRLREAAERAQRKQEEELRRLREQVAKVSRRSAATPSTCSIEGLQSTCCAFAVFRRTLLMALQYEDQARLAKLREVSLRS